MISAQRPRRDPPVPGLGWMNTPERQHHGPRTRRSTPPLSRVRPPYSCACAWVDGGRWAVQRIVRVGGRGSGRGMKIEMKLLPGTMMRKLLPGTMMGKVRTCLDFARDLNRWPRVVMMGIGITSCSDGVITDSSCKDTPAEHRFVPCTHIPIPTVPSPYSCTACPPSSSSAASEPAAWAAGIAAHGERAGSYSKIPETTIPICRISPELGASDMKLRMQTGRRHSPIRLI